MKIRILTITHKSPPWISEGYQEYAKRLPSGYSLELVEIPAEKRANNIDKKRLLKRENEKLQAAIKSDYIIALDSKGISWTTEELATQLNQWQLAGQNIDLIIGGPDGLPPECLARANQVWSLSKLTFPHILVKVIIAEQIYRAYTILKNHPYHR